MRAGGVSGETGRKFPIALTFLTALAFSPLQKAVKSLAFIRKNGSIWNPIFAKNSFKERMKNNL